VHGACHAPGLPDSSGLAAAAQGLMATGRPLTTL